MAAELREQQGAATDQQEQKSQEIGAPPSSNGAGANGSPGLRAAVKAGALAAAAGTTLYVTRRVMRSSSGERGEHPGDSGHAAKSEAKGAAQERKSGAGGRFDTFLSTLNPQGLRAAANMFVPVAEDAARAAGEYAAERAPDFLADRILPKFVEGFNRAREKARGAQSSSPRAEESLGSS
jgi:hypothetical protein